MADLKFNNVTPTTGSLKVGSNDVSKVYLGSTQVWPITLVTDPNTGIYGNFTGTADDTQSGTANVYTQTKQTYFNGVTNLQQNRVATSLITDSTFNVFRFTARANSGTFTMNSVQISAYSDSARTSLVTETSLWTGPATMTSTYSDPWGSLTLTPGTYFLKISFNLTSTQQQGYQLTLT